MLVTALKSFDHNGSINKGQTFDCSEIVAHGLKRAKLVTFDDPKANFPMAGASLPSASPPVPALQQTIAKPLDAGANLKKKPGRKKKSS